MIYIKAKWVAHRYKLPFYFQPFPRSDLFAMYEKENHLSGVTARKYPKRVLLKQVSGSLDSQITSNALYTIHYYFSLPHWGDTQSKYDSQEIMLWPEIINDELFKNELRKLIKPRKAIALQKIPKEKVSVAVHVRKGGGFDHPLFSTQLYNIETLPPFESTPVITYADKYWPLKFLPDQYYIDQINRLSEILDNAPMHIHIFTDDTDPERIVKLYEEQVHQENISFSCRKTGNHHTQNLLEDIFSMATFDCLIRNGSNYPQIAQLIGNHKIVIYPISCKWIGKALIVDKVGTYKQS